MNMNKLYLVLAVFVMSVLATSLVSATVYITDVELDEDSLSPTSTNFVRDVARGESFDVKVHLYSDVAMSNVQVEAELRGYDHDDRVEDITDVFDMKANVTYVKKLSLKFPLRMDQDRYKLRVQVEDRDSVTYEETYELEIDTARHALVIKDIILSPANYVKAGRALLATARIKNYGERDEEGVKVTFSIPELGVKASDYVDNIEAEESTTTEELYVRIPECAEAKEYACEVEVVYDDGDEVTRKSCSVEVVEGDLCPAKAEEPSEAQKAKAKTVITVGPTTQDVVKGEAGTVYPLTLTNAGSSKRTYTVSVDVVGDWANVQISPSNVVVLDAGETTTVYVYVSAKETAAAGENMFSVTVSSGEETLKQIPMKANVVEKQVTVSGWSKLKRALEVAVVVLVVLLVILGLIIGFSKLKGSEEEAEEEAGKTYY